MSQPLVHHGPPVVTLLPELVASLTAAWPDLVAMLTWWRERQQLTAGDDQARELVRQTYHIDKRFIEAVKREAALTGTSYSAVVNRAFAEYFGRRGENH